MHDRIRSTSPGGFDTAMIGIEVSMSVLKLARKVWDMSPYLTTDGKLDCLALSKVEWSKEDTDAND